ncbi:hypothetical protein LK994_12045 [Ferruginibacter lapsinanis]|uniref:hypothetical protein n=1 Tax=Ferruginibacter lapsinanis TaxID=563172 RepID=UPI001E35BF75|nr:hypothetical protein [Ferruginibacter lapsinanis]UEG49363.1 hypothetical protein LK994_12045 [Ferruginibacter lapsinanis]
MSYIIAVPIILHVTITGSLIYGVIQLNRFISKEIFQRLYFKEEIHMPTTNFLLHSDKSLSNGMKDKLREKIHNELNIALLNQRDEKKNEIEARKQIAFAVSQIRNKTRDNKLLLQHNIEYGFIRNLVGGSLIALFACVANIIIFKNIHPINIAYKVSIGLLIFYALIVLLSKWGIMRNGRAYAKVLFEQYLST